MCFQLIRKKIINFTAVPLLLLVSGCAVVDIDKTTYLKKDNLVIEQSLIDEIIIGMTTEQWLKNYIGKPDFVQKHNASVVYQYRFRQLQHNKVRVLLAYRQQNINEDDYILNVELSQGVVRNFWRSHTLVEDISKPKGYEY